MWPVNPSLITLRVCADLDWKVTVGCPKCRISTTLHGKTLGASKLADIEIARLFERRAFKCYKVQYGCSGTPADRVTVDCIDVGMMKQVAEWKR